MSMIEVDDYRVLPNIPKSRGMRVVGIYPKFDYKNKLQNAYGKNIAKEEGIDEKVRDRIKRAIKAGKWKPAHYPKPATMEKTDVMDINSLLTGFTTMSAHILAKEDTMFIYLVEFFEAPDEDGVMQPAEFWRRAWRTKENVSEDFDYIKSEYKRENIIKGAAELLILGAYTEVDGVYARNNIVSVLRSIGIANPNDNWVNDVRENINPTVGVMTNADDFDVSDNPKLKKSVIVETKTYGGKTDPKMDSQTVDALEEQIVNKSHEIKKKLDNKEDFDITVVAKTTNVRIERAEQIRNIKKDVVLNIYKERYENYKVINDLVENHNFSLDEVFQIMWRGQKPDEKAGEIYVN